MAPPTVLIAQNDEEKTAKLQAECDDLKSKLKAMDEDHKDEVAKLKAADSYQEPGPEVHAKLIASLKKAMDDMDEKEAKGKMAKAIKAMEEVFDTGNGVNTNAMSDEDDLHAMDEEKKEQSAVIATLTAKYVKPLIAKILQAKQIAGATSEQLAADQKALSAMKLPEFEALYASQEVFINQALKAQAVEHTESLFAKVESEFEFNGSALTGKTIDIDAAREAIQI